MNQYHASDKTFVKIIQWFVNLQRTGRSQWNNFCGNQTDNRVSKFWNLEKRKFDPEQLSRLFSISMATMI